MANILQKWVSHYFFFKLKTETVLSSWMQVPKLEVYDVHCGNQVRAKSVLDDKRSTNPRVEDFLTRCLESPFSRRLDVWSYSGMNFLATVAVFTSLFRFKSYNLKFSLHYQMCQNQGWSSTHCLSSRSWSKRTRIIQTFPFWNAFWRLCPAFWVELTKRPDWLVAVRLSVEWICRMKWDPYCHRPRRWFARDSWKLVKASNCNVSCSSRGWFWRVLRPRIG